jgi:hypothetical protein
MTLKSSEDEKPVIEARTNCFLRLPAVVEGAEFIVWVERFTKVMAQQQGPDDYTIVWPYGVTSAEARVTRSVLII